MLTVLARANLTNAKVTEADLAFADLAGALRTPGAGG
jgi:hypothetical protein